MPLFHFYFERIFRLFLIVTANVLLCVMFSEFYTSGFMDDTIFLAPLSTPDHALDQRRRCKDHVRGGAAVNILV